MMTPEAREKLIEDTITALDECIESKYDLHRGEARRVLEAFAEKMMACDECGQTGLLGGEECKCGGPR
jgi:hypothetical protein